MIEAEKHLSKQKATSGLSSIDNDNFLVTELDLVILTVEFNLHQNENKFVPN